MHADISSSSLTSGTGCGKLRRNYMKYSLAIKFGAGHGPDLPLRLPQVSLSKIKTRNQMSSIISWNKTEKIGSLRAYLHCIAYILSLESFFPLYNYAQCCQCVSFKKL